MQSRKFIEFHILQSFPVSCLNRDDVGAPKSAIVGGVSRARVSSQCWKRAVRLTMRDFGVTMGTRTKKLQALLKPQCLALGADEAQAQAASDAISAALGKDTLYFFSPNEAQALAQWAKGLDFDAKKIKDKEVHKAAKKAISPHLDALDIALFGRMVANSQMLNVEASCSFAHAISTHQVANELDFFTALDDFKHVHDSSNESLEDDSGSSHLGTIEYNSATYYRYISLDLAQLMHHLGDLDAVKTALEQFTKALFLAVPSARQSTQSSACLWDFARVLVRKGQRLQVSFEKPVRHERQGYLAPSINALNDSLAQKELMMGSLYGLDHISDQVNGDYSIGGSDSKLSIDTLITQLTQHLDGDHG